MNKLNVRFDIVASTGRTATTYLSSALDQIDGVAACHEGYKAADKTNEPLLPLINLENDKMYRNPRSALEIVAEKRGQDILNKCGQSSKGQHIIDVAYYNPTLAAPLLEQLPDARMVGIIRNCAEFVRSSTTLHGEDPLPVGWPDPAKELTPREQFIAMGRLRPRPGSAAAGVWRAWDGIMRNIWLWEATNQLLVDAQRAYPKRVCLLRFETLRNQPAVFWRHLTRFLDLHPTQDMTRAGQNEKKNEKPFGYQIGDFESWSEDAQAALAASQKRIDESVSYEC